MKVNYKGREIQIDEEDLHLLKEYTWSYNRHGYLLAHIDGKTQSLQKVILNTPDDMESDHINRDVNDYRRSNLRIATQSLNIQNQSKNAYDCYGVSPNWKKWQAYVSIGGSRNLGRFDTKEEACRVRDIWAIYAYGKEANLNFPENREDYIKYWEQVKRGRSKPQPY